MLDLRLSNQVLEFAWLTMNFNGIPYRTLTPMKRSVDHSMSKCDLKALGRLGARRVVCAGLASAIFLLGAVIPAHSDTNLLPGAPQLYTVQFGDSLWSIATRFFRDPWRWTEILQRNPQISNPELLFAGDVLVLGQGDAGVQLKVLRVEKMSPWLRVVGQKRAVPSIAPHVIQPFLVSAEIQQTAELPNSGYVVAGTEGETTLGQFARFYARDLPLSSAGDYHVMRFGERFIDPDSGEYLGRSVMRIGTANLISGDEISILELVYSREEIEAGDRLVPVKEYAGLPYFFPRIPEAKLQGHIVGIATGVREAGLFSVVTVSVGTKDGVQPGDVLQVTRPVTASDSVAVRPVELPGHSSAYVMIFKVFHKASFALIIRARRPVNLYDHISSPGHLSDV